MIVVESNMKHKHYAGEPPPAKHALYCTLIFDKVKSHAKGLGISCFRLKINGIDIQE